MTTDPVRTHEARRPGLVQMITEVADLSTGLGIMLLPLLATALPGVILLLVLPAVLLLAAAVAPIVLLAIVVMPPYLLVHAVRRRRLRRGVG